MTCPCISPPAQAHASENLLIRLLRARPGVLTAVLADAGKYRLQVLYTQIDRDRNNKPQFTSYGLYVNTDSYFYPASSVKLPAAALALEKLNNLNIPGLDKYTALRVDSAFSNQTIVLTDSSSASNLPSIAHYIRKILLASDNDAYNRLFEFLGQKYLNKSLWQKGYSRTKIIRRLSVAATPEQNRATNPFTFYDRATTFYTQPSVQNTDIYKVEIPGVKQGVAYMQNGQLVKRPIDFTYSNYFPVHEQQAVLKAILFPESVAEAMRFNLTQDDYRFLYTYMSMLPRESTWPAYGDTAQYPDSHGKYVMFAGSKKRIPDHIRVFNKIGAAYGYLIDNAYVVDFDKRIEFLLTAVLQVNENRIYNDDTYEYDEIGLPFLAALGQAIYEHEIRRERKYAPELGRFTVH